MSDGNREAAASTLLAVAGAHLRGEPLHPVLMALGATFVRSTLTAPIYRMVALRAVPGPGGRPGTPPRPGLIRCPGGQGTSAEVELYRMPVPSLGALLLDVAPPLAIGTVSLVDGGQVLGFVCEGWAAAESADISAHGGWRRYLAALDSGLGSGARNGV